MNFRFILALTVTGCLSAGVVSSANSGNNPYNTIVERNVFSLVPIPVAPPPVDPATLIPPPKITPNGIMKLFGKLQVIFKVAAPAKPGQPPQDESHVMGEGEREDDITVQKIDEPGAMITFDNHGVIQQLPLVVSAAASGGPAPGAHSLAPSPRVAPASGATTPAVNFGGRFGRNRNNPANPGPAAPSPSEVAPTPSAPSFNGANAPVPPAEEISPEEQVINMESQRAKWLDEGNPAAAIMPPTEITGQVTGEGDSGGSPGPPGLPTLPPRR